MTPESMRITLPPESPLATPDFLFGVATSAYQIEGASDERLPCIWDTFCAQPGAIADGSDGRVACEHVAHMDSDLDRLSWLGIDAYRFSINWARVIREDGSVNEAGLDVYRRLLAGLHQRGIQAFATLYHWELPAHLQQQGGWPERDIAGRFADYADAVSRRLGDQVASWATLNEPWCSAWLGYGIGIHAPGVVDQAKSRHASHHLLLGHAMALEALRANAPDANHGIVLNFAPCHPDSDSPEDIAAAKRADDFHYQWYLMPLMEGRYPELAETLPADQQPPIMAGDLERIRAPLDFLGVNYYTRQVFRAGGTTGFQEVAPEGDLTDMGWEVYPEGLEELLRGLDEKHDLPPVYICENGAAFPDVLVNGVVLDPDRIRYLENHLAAVDRVVRDGVDVRGYFCWSLMDNFEWAEGYAKRFGLYYTDYGTGERVPKSSAAAYRAMLNDRRLAVVEG